MVARATLFSSRSPKEVERLDAETSSRGFSVGLKFAGSCMNWYFGLFAALLGCSISAIMDLVVGRAVLEATPPKVVVLVLTG